MKKRSLFIAVGTVFGLAATALVVKSIFLPSDSAVVEAYRKAGMPWSAEELDGKHHAEAGSGADAESAADDLKRAAASLEPSAANLVAFRPKSVLPSSEAKQALEILSIHKKALDYAIAASVKKSYGVRRDWDLDVGGIETEASNLAVLMGLLCIRAEAYMRTGEMDKGLADWQSALRLNLLARQIPDSIAADYVASSTAAIAESAIRLIHLASGRPEIIAKIADGFGELDSDLDWKSIIKSDGYSYLAAFRNSQNHEEALRHLSQPLPVTNPARNRVVREGLPADEEMKASVVDVLSFYAKLGKAMSEPQMSLAGMAKFIVQEEEKLERDGKGPGTYSLGQILTRVASAQAQVRAAHCLVLLSRTKSAGSSSAVSSLPEQVIDPFTGQPIKFIERSNGMKAWSIGPDLLDDGGISQEDAKRLAASPMAVVTYDRVAELPVSERPWPWLTRWEAPKEPKGSPKKIVPRRPAGASAKFETAVMKPGSNTLAPLSIRRPILRAMAGS